MSKRPVIKTYIPSRVLLKFTNGRRQTRRQWMQMKRWQMDEVIDAFKLFSFGSAYTPVRSSIELGKQLQAMRDSLQVKRWKGLKPPNDCD